MTLLDWLRVTGKRLYEDGIDGVDDSIRDLQCGYLRRRPSKWNGGMNMYDRDWDLLVVLDACRYDLFEEVIDEYQFDSLGEFHSPGSCSDEWMQETFTDEYQTDIEDTIYVNGNPNGPDNLPTDRFLYFEDVWSYAWDEELGTVRPGPLTDRAVALHRNHDPERMVIHYMQPHHPFVRKPVEVDEGIDATGSKSTRTVWNSLRAGTVEYDRVWDAYLDNLRYILDELDTLLSNVDAKRTVLTADHGNLVGEYRLYGHPVGVPVEELRRVPWVETVATDEKTFQPTLEPPETSVTSKEINKRLAALGYV